MSPRAFQPFSAVTRSVSTHIIESPEFGADRHDDRHRRGVSPADPLRRRPHRPLHLSGIAQSSSSYSLPPPLSLPPAVEEGGPSSTSSMSTYRRRRGPGAASPPAPCGGRRPPTPMPFGGGARRSILVPLAAKRTSCDCGGTTDARRGRGRGRAGGAGGSAAPLTP